MEKSVEYNLRSKAENTIVALADKKEARIQMHPKLAAFKINDENTTYSDRQLLQLVKRNRSMFASPDEHTAFVKGLQAFKGSAQVQIERTDDRKGNVTANYSKSTQVSVAL